AGEAAEIAQAARGHRADAELVGDRGRAKGPRGVGDNGDVAVAVEDGRRIDLHSATTCQAVQLRFANTHAPMIVVWVRLAERHEPSADLNRSTSSRASGMRRKQRSPRLVAITTPACRAGP